MQRVVGAEFKPIAASKAMGQVNEGRRNEKRAEGSLGGCNQMRRAKNVERVEGIEPLLVKKPRKRVFV
ncbi:hypothetical protein DZC75_16580 [Pseudomonas parafulva]|uniref:Uncharacterized protein n=1 Tax=Pseudomonas parafulva TaxID=157782 RepID=A0AAI8PCJ5_9PSED|nr:hypothetical protein DZC75_16580 [Pseudomonas parafulva]